MKYTLITFAWNPRDYEAGSHWPTVQKAWEGYTVEIDRGVYLFQTVRDALGIHLLSEHLRSRSLCFLMLRFEEATSELFGFFPDDVAAQLKSKLGFAVGNLKDPKKP